MRLFNEKRKTGKDHRADKRKSNRNPDCFIRIKPECEQVSRYHLAIYKHNGKIYVQDISSNGTEILR